MDDMEFLVIRNYLNHKRKFDKTNDINYLETNKSVANYNAQKLLMMRERIKFHCEKMKVN